MFLPFDRVMHSCSSACAHHQKLVVNMVTVMAEYLNADRSALTRELNQMKQEGFIDFEKNMFRILKEFESC